METCQRVANATQVKVATATRSKQLHPRVGHGVESREMLGIMPPQASGDYSVFTGFWYGSRGAFVVEC